MQDGARVDFYEFESDDEADGLSTATELNLDDNAVQELALYLIEYVRDEREGGFYSDRLRQVPISDDTNIRVREALSLMAYSAVDRSFDDNLLVAAIEFRDIQVGTDVEGKTTNVTWDHMSDRDKARVIAEMRDHLQEESSFWTYTDQVHIAAEVAVPGDTVDHYVNRQLDMWRGEYVWPDGRKTHNYRDLVYNPSDYARVEEELRTHLIRRYTRKNVDQLHKNPDEWFRSRYFEIIGLIDDAIEDPSSLVTGDGQVDPNAILREAGNIIHEMLDQAVLFEQFDVPEGIRMDNTKTAMIESKLRELVQNQVMLAAENAIDECDTPPGSPPGTPPGEDPVPR